MKYKLYAVRIFCFEWEESLAFYRDTLGFPLEFADDTIGWAQFSLGNAYLGLERCDPTDHEASSLVGRFVGTSIEVKDVYKTYRELTNKGVQFISEPKQQAWGGVLAHFKDPDGNTLTFLGRPTE